MDVISSNILWKIANEHESHDAPCRRGSKLLRLLCSGASLEAINSVVCLACLRIISYGGTELNGALSSVGVRGPSVLRYSNIKHTANNPHRWTYEYHIAFFRYHQRWRPGIDAIISGYDRIKCGIHPPTLKISRATISLISVQQGRLQGWSVLNLFHEKIPPAGSFSGHLVVVGVHRPDQCLVVEVVGKDGEIEVVEKFLVGRRQMMWHGGVVGYRSFHIRRQFMTVILWQAIDSSGVVGSPWLQLYQAWRIKVS